MRLSETATGWLLAALVVAAIAAIVYIRSWPDGQPPWRWWPRWVHKVDQFSAKMEEKTKWLP